MTDEDREETVKRHTGELAMALIDLTSPEYLRLCDAASFAHTELAAYMRVRGCGWDFIAASGAGLTAATVMGLRDEGTLLDPPEYTP